MQILNGTHKKMIIMIIIVSNLHEAKWLISTNYFEAKCLLTLVTSNEMFFSTNLSVTVSSTNWSLRVL